MPGASTMSMVLAAKQDSLKRCIKRIREVWKRPSELPFEDDLDKQEPIILNLVRAFEILLDMANHLGRVRKLGWPRDNAETFDLLKKAGLITEEMKDNLKKGNAIRNILVHRYEEIDLTKVKDVVENHLAEILESGQALFRHGPESIVFQDASYHDDNDSLKPG